MRLTGCIIQEFLYLPQCFANSRRVFMKTEQAASGMDLIPGCLPDKGWQSLSLCNAVS